MRYSLTQITTLALCLTLGTTVDAGDPKRLTQACPRLAPIDGVSAGTTIIDNAAVLRLAEQGRIAAVSKSSPSALAPSGLKSTNESTSKNQWRSKHQKSVSAIHTIKQQLAQVGREHQALKSKWFAVSKESQRIRIELRMKVKAQQVRQLQEKLRGSMGEFSSLIRRARLAGAQPGWFRDLPRP